MIGDRNLLSEGYLISLFSLCQLDCNVVRVDDAALLFEKGYDFVLVFTAYHIVTLGDFAVDQHSHKLFKFRQ